MPTLSTAKSCPCRKGDWANVESTVTTTTAANTVNTSTMSTTKATTEATTKSTTKATTKATTASTTEATTKSGSCSNFSQVSSEITWYQKKPDGGNCGLDWDWLKSNSKGYTNFVALPKGNNKNAYDDHSNCGRCIKLKCNPCQTDLVYPGQDLCNGGDTIAMVVDSCPTCNHFGDVDTSTAVWNSVSGNEAFSLYPGSYEFIECPTEFASGNSFIRFKDGSNQWWTAVQPVNFKNKIKKIQYRKNGKMINAKMGNAAGIDSFYYLLDNADWPAQICVTNDDNVEACATVQMPSNFETQTVDLGQSL